MLMIYIFTLNFTAWIFSIRYMISIPLFLFCVIHVRRVNNLKIIGLYDNTHIYIYIYIYIYHFGNV